MEGEELAYAVCQAADDKLAEEITILDLRGISTIADYFVICTGTSLPHLKAIRREIRDQLSGKHGVRARNADGEAESHWLVLDYADVIVHVFHADARAHYALEDLWSDAPRLAWPRQSEEEAAAAG